MRENEISQKIIGLAIKTHKKLGPGLLEKVYHECLYYEIQKSGLQVQKEVYVHVDYEEIKIERAFKIDLLVENKLIVELKSVKELNDIYIAQTLTYLRLSKIRLGLLINFNEILLKDGIRRIINN
jgi:GxxExxY protein